MATQTLKKTCTVFMIAAIFTMTFSAQISQSANVEMCVKHCVPNQCMKVMKNPDPAVCEEACKKLCNKPQTASTEWIIPPKDGSGGFLSDTICWLSNNKGC